MKKEINWEEEEQKHQQKHQQSKREKSVFYSENSEDSDSDDRPADNFRALAHRRRTVPPRLANGFHLPRLEKLHAGPPSRLPRRRPRKRTRDSLDSEDQEECLSKAALETEGGMDWVGDLESSTECRQEGRLLFPGPEAEFGDALGKIDVFPPENERSPPPCSLTSNSGYESGYHLADEEDGESSSETLVHVGLPERSNLACFERSSLPLIGSDHFDTPLAVVTCCQEAIISGRSLAEPREVDEPKTALCYNKRVLELKIDNETTSRLILPESAVESASLTRSPPRQSTNAHRSYGDTAEPLVDPDPILPLQRGSHPRKLSSTRHQQQHCGSESLTLPVGSHRTAVCSPTSALSIFYSPPSPPLSLCPCDSCRQPSTCTCDLYCPGAAVHQCEYRLGYIPPLPCPVQHCSPNSFCCGNYEPCSRIPVNCYDELVITPHGYASECCRSPLGSSIDPVADTPCRHVSGPLPATNFVHSNS